MNDKLWSCRSTPWMIDARVDLNRVCQFPGTLIQRLTPHSLLSSHHPSAYPLHSWYPGCVAGVIQLACGRLVAEHRIRISYYRTDNERQGHYIQYRIDVDCSGAPPRICPSCRTLCCRSKPTQATRCLADAKAAALSVAILLYAGRDALPQDISGFHRNIALPVLADEEHAGG